MLITIAHAQPFGGAPGCCGNPSPIVDIIYLGLVIATVAIVLYAAFFGKTK